jgi:hypothetical protein
MSSSLVDIPLDVLMEISREVDLPDSLHLTAVRSYSRQKDEN